MSAHTPGPFEVFELENNGRMYIRAKDGTCIARVLGEQGNPLREANADLFAAAAELLEALTELVRRADSQCAPDAQAVGYREARAAIAKATGSAI